MIPSTVLLEDSITTALSVLGHLPSMWFSKSSFSKARRCRKSCIVHGGLQATALHAVFTLYNFFYSLPLFIITCFSSLPIRKRKLVLLLGISSKKRQTVLRAWPQNSSWSCPLIPVTFLLPSRGPGKSGQAVRKKGGDNISGDNLHWQ